MMPQNSIIYSCTALKGTNKVGNLKPAENGYYTVVLGALNIFNSGGSYYPYEPAKKLFEENSIFQRRVASGALRGEYGHPRKGSMSDAQFMNRLVDIYEPNVSHHIRRVWIDTNAVKDREGRPVIAIMGEVRPCGPQGKVLAASFENPDENVCFSIRSITNDRMIGGVNNKAIRIIATWDYVNEPGLAPAMKWFAPGLESMSEETLAPSLREMTQLMNEQRASGLESSSGLSMEAVCRELGLTAESRLPPSARW